MLKNDYQHPDYHKRECCDGCGWFNKPYASDYVIAYGGFDVECCPDCGGEVSISIGRLVYRDVAYRPWHTLFIQQTDRKYIMFERRVA